MKRKILALGLTFCLLCSICSTAFAASNDYAPPEITSVSMNAPGVTVAAGDALYFRVNVTDESPIDDVNLYFELETTDETASNDCVARMESYDTETGVATLTFEVTENMPSGIWRLDWIAVSDFYGNQRFYHSYDENTNLAFEDCWFIVSGSPEDHTAPVITNIFMETPGMTGTAGDTLYFYANVTDEAPIDDVNLYFELETTDETASNDCVARMESYDTETGVATLTFEVTENMPSGIWRLDWIAVSDFYGNQRFYHSYDENTNLAFEDCWFIVSGSPEDHTAPVITNIFMETPGMTGTAGDTLYFYANVTDEAPIDDVNLYFELETTDETASNDCVARMESYDTETGVATLTFEVTENMPSGIWRLDWIAVSDFYGNQRFYHNYDENTDIAFEDCWFSVAHSDIVPISVSIPEIITVSVRDVYTIRPDVEPVTALPNWTWTSSDTTIAEIASSGNHLTALVTGVNPGVVTVTGTTSNGLSASCEVTVVDAPMPTGIEIEETYSLGVDETLNIEPILTPGDATTLYEVTTDNPHVVEVGTTGGHTGVTITGVNAGHATITIRGCNNVMASTVVTVGQPDDRQHEKVTVAAIDATCYREGRTSYIRCSACGYRFTEPQTIPMIAHEYGEWIVVKAATATEDGLRERSCANCGQWETEIIPALGGSGNENSGGGSSTGGNSGGGGSSTSANKNEMIDVGSGSISAIVKGQEAEISATEKEISKIVRDAESSGSVELDVSELNVSAASIPQNLITAVRDSEAVSTLSIKTSHGSMVIDPAVLDTIAKALENENDSISLGIETIDVNDIPSTQRYPIANVMNSAVFVTLSASVTHRDTNGNPLDTEQLHELGGNVTISVPYQQPANMEGRQIIACYFGENGAITYFPARYENGIVTFETSHFSQFGVFASQAAAFTDVNLDAWYMTEVEFAMANKFMSGYGDGRFAPDVPLSRAMLAQILYNMAGKPSVDNCIFADVPSGAWYYDAVTWAAANGIVGGYGNGLFGPNDPITREQLATMLYRYEQSQGGGFVNDWAFLLDYPDRDNVSGYAYEALCWCTMNGIITGMTDGTLNPQGAATRAQAAVMLMRFVQNVA